MGADRQGGRPRIGSRPVTTFVKKLVGLTAALAAAVAVVVPFTIPPPSLPLAASPDGSVRGVIHVHTNRSDGSSGPDEVAAAAARSGAKFLILTDHGDGTRKPDPPTYRSGVLCLDGVEISTTGGHYIALDMPPSPYPLGGEARDVVEDVRRLGGFGIAAHPDSPKPELRWREWTAPFDGMELQNLDTNWRLVAGQAGWRPRWRVFEALIDYPFRPSEVIASLIQPPGALYNWEALTRRRRVVVTAGADAHARLALRSADPGDSRYALPFPGYDSTFRVMSVHVRPDRALTGDATADAAELIRAIRGGHLYTAIDAVASPPSFAFTAANTTGTASEGDELMTGGPVLLHVRSNAPPTFSTIVHDGLRTIATNTGAPDLTVHAPAAPGVYWVEIVSTGNKRPIAWVRSNPIYVRAAGPAGTRPVRPGARASTLMFDGRTGNGWRAEHDSTSLASLDAAPRAAGAELRLRYGLSGGEPASQFAGLVFDTPEGAAPHDRLTFTARAEQPMRISVQLRAGERDRWQRSVYVETTDKEQTIFFDDFMPVGGTQTMKPSLADLRSILFVIDTTNTKPGSSGRLWIRSAALQK